MYKIIIIKIKKGYESKIEKWNKNYLVKHFSKIKDINKNKQQIINIVNQKFHC